MDWSAVDVRVPHPSARLPGVSMAGFTQRAPGSFDISMVVHPSVTLLIDLSDGEGAIYDAYGSHERGSVAVGLLPRDFRAAGRQVDCLQIRLSPVALPDLRGLVVPLAEVWDCKDLEDRLRATTSWDARFAIAAAALARRLDVTPSVDPEVAHIWRRTRRGRGRVRVEGLAEEVGWSRKRLWSRFRAQVGVSPKRAAGLVRFDHAVHLLAAGHPPAEVAAVAGYVDQSHLHREVRSFAGLTPTAVAAAPWLEIDDVAWPAS
ncbi:helix-turn-helix domain-containing protein [Actinoplanes sp. CA-142083]|uniref:AraC family transcriptional regulator n=1 Tax=Actinoplanes sp. CA-142083 TaxID=3239903 RepID=UPI003D8F64A5